MGHGHTSQKARCAVLLACINRIMLDMDYVCMQGRSDAPYS